MKEKIRMPVVAGQFYPAHKENIETFIAGELASLPGSKTDKPKLVAKGVILPHAGYIYSGGVAIAVVKEIAPVKRVLILGPNHTGYGKPFSLYPEGYWRTPYGDIPVDEELAECILSQSKHITSDTLAHQFEHSIEVELPIISHFFGDFKFLPLACKCMGWEYYREVAEEIFSGLVKISSKSRFSGEEKFILVASSDMTHYEPESSARKKDRLALEKIMELDPEGLVKIVEEKNITMCGIAPVAIMLYVVKKIKAKKAYVIKYDTSGSRSGDYSQVVGYAGVVIT